MDSNELKRRRRLYRLPDSPVEIQEETIRRRKIHKMAVVFVDYWDQFFLGVAILVGFFIVLLPAMLPAWKAYISSNFLAKWIFQHFSSLGFLFLVPLLVGIAINMACDLKGKDQPFQWLTGNPFSYPTPSEIIDLELYPSNKREEVAYFLNIASMSLGSIGILGYFCVAAYFIRSWQL